MSLEQLVQNIDTQVAALDEKLHQCEQQLQGCDRKRQPFLEREIDALKNTRTKLVKSRSLAVQAYKLRHNLEGHTTQAPVRPNYWRIAAIILVAILASIATLLLT